MEFIVIVNVKGLILAEFIVIVNVKGLILVEFIAIMLLIRKIGMRMLILVRNMA